MFFRQALCKTDGTEGKDLQLDKMTTIDRNMVPHQKQLWYGEGYRTSSSWQDVGQVLLFGKLWNT